MNFTFPTNEIAQIVGNALDVDKEFVEEITRQIKAEGRTLNIKYDFDCQYIKSFKKSLSSLYENMKLVKETIKDFSPK